MPGWYAMVTWAATLWFAIIACGAVLTVDEAPNETVVAEEGAASARTEITLDDVRTVLLNEWIAQVTPSPEHGFTVVPPGPVSDKIEIELRLAVRNNEGEKQAFGVRFYWDKAEPANLITHQTIEIAPHSHGLVSAWAPTSRHVGRRDALYEIRREDEAEEVVAQGAWPIEIIESATTALPWIQGGWFDPGTLISAAYEDYRDRPATAEDARNLVDGMATVGMTTIIITYSEMTLYDWGVFYPSQIEELGEQQADFSVVEVVLDQAAKNGQHVFVGLGRGQDLWLTWKGFKDPARIRKAIDVDARMALELWELYSRYDSFYGWYIAHEANDLERANNYYNPLTKILHRFSPDKPVLISPAGTPIVAPEIISRCQLDVIAYQDAVGSGYVPYENTWDPQRRIDMLQDIYGSYRAAHYGTRKHLWTNLEIWQMPGPEYGGGFAPTIERVLKQLDIEKNYVQMITAYTFTNFMTPPQCADLGLGGEKALQLYRDYRNYYFEQRALTQKPPQDLVSDASSN